MDQDKEYAPYRLGLALLKIIEANETAAQSGHEKHKSIHSLRKLAAASRVEYSIVQKISTAKRNPSFSTFINLLDGLGMSLSEFASIYDAIPEAEVLQYKNELTKKGQQKKANKKTASREKKVKNKK